MDSLMPRDVRTLYCSGSREFLFLQGVASSLFEGLGHSLLAKAYGVHRINFNGGDKLFWKIPNALDYRGNLQDWPAFLVEKIAIWNITDIVMFGDCRPLHRAAIDQVRKLGIALHIFEEGYLRPDWLTLENEGINGFSSAPKTLDGYLHDPSEAFESEESIPSTLPYRSVRDVCYTLATLALSWYFPGYRHYRLYHPLVEYASGARRLAHRLIRQKRYQKAMKELTAGDQAYYVWPMQIEADSQINIHSQFSGVEEAIEVVFKSFGRYAPAVAKLALTEHPLETSPKDWRGFVLKQAARHGLADRIEYYVGGSPDHMLARSKGVVVINSTVGQKALLLGVPVIALSCAVFNVAGLTFQHGLDKFWNEAKAADAEIVRNYRRGLIKRSQINGGAYSKRGIEVAIRNAVYRMEHALELVD